MTVKTTLKSQYGTPLGYLEVDGSVTKLTNQYGTPLGFFDSKTNQTVTVTGQPVGRGNLLVSLLPPRKRPNAERRSREFLTPAEVERLAEAAQKVGRHGHRNGTLIQIAYRHALRVSELTALRWDQVDLAQGLRHVRRRKSGNLNTHPLHGPELRALRRLQRDYPDSPYIFTGERKGPLTDSTVRKMVARAIQGLLGRLTAGTCILPRGTLHGVTCPATQR